MHDFFMHEKRSDKRWRLLSTKVGAGLGRPWRSARLTLPRAPPPPGPLINTLKPGGGANVEDCWIQRVVRTADLSADRLWQY